METVFVYVLTTALIGFIMYLFGVLSKHDRELEHQDVVWSDGFRAGWEASEQFDNDVKTIWGG